MLAFSDGFACRAWLRQQSRTLMSIMALENDNSLSFTMMLLMLDELK